MSAPPPRTDALARSIGILYTLTLFCMALTGFGQMPICSRYYMSDIQGLGWLADFFVTRNVHCIGAAILLGGVSCAAFDFVLSKRRRATLTASGRVRAVLLSAIVVSGALIVFKNFPCVHFSDGMIIGLDLFHLGAAMAFLVASLVCRIARKKWAIAA